ncbi:BLUF domain-containing protein [Primorskyibacter sp. 2E107]|uniref:BLUF domain-containing protein n=1 Tax=Primorskyibacter sp. 2E107 TaxID=3403458 RepID=UPI003AF4CE1A
MSLFQLFYVSASLHPSGHRSDMEILETAQDHNSENGITGFLLRTPTRFVQILEGTEASVHDVFSRIANDERHKSIRHIARDMVTQRYFPEWSMGFATRTDTLAANLVETLSAEAPDFQEALDMLLSIASDTMRSA